MTTAEGGVRPRTARMRLAFHSRIYGLGGVYAKTLRDSRLAILIMGGMLGAVLLAGGAAYGEGYGTPESRTGLANVFRGLPPVMAGLYGNPAPANLETLGGLVSVKNAASVALMASIWSILALSATLASESRRGSMDLVAVAGMGRRRIALEKLAAHVTGMAIVITVIALASRLVGVMFGSLAGDAISWAAAIGFALWVGLLALASGSAAFALATLIGRGGAAGIAGAVLVGGYFVNGYRAAVPALSWLANASWFGWTTRHQALAGQFDWWSLLPVLLVVVVLFAAGVELFVRRDLGATTPIPLPAIPAAVLGLGGPAPRSLAERLPGALAWGCGIGLFGLVMGAAAGAFNATLGESSPETLRLFETLFPQIEMTNAGGFLQIVFVQFGYILVGFAAATLVSGWATDETQGRLELILASPLERAAWAMRSGLGVQAAIAVMTVLLAVGVAVGVLAAGRGDLELMTPVLGTIVLGLYAAALAGLGLAIGGAARTSFAGESVAALVIATFLLDLLGPALGLPDWAYRLALTTHLGQPMLGHWDWNGVAVCLGLAFGGPVLAAWGMGRRDVSA